MIIGLPSFGPRSIVPRVTSLPLRSPGTPRFEVDLDKLSEQLDKGDLYSVIDNVLRFPSGTTRFGTNIVSRGAKTVYRMVSNNNKGEENTMTQPARENNNKKGSKRVRSNPNRSTDDTPPNSGSPSSGGGGRFPKGSTQGSKFTRSNNKYSANLQVLQGLRPNLSTEEYELNPQLSLRTYSFAGFAYNEPNDWYHLSGYNASSVFSIEMPLIFNSMDRDVKSLTSSRFTDVFTKEKFAYYMQYSTRALELYYYLSSVLSYSSRADYSDRLTANEYLIPYYSRYSVTNGLQRLASIFKGRYFPPVLHEMIYNTFQLRKTGDLEQSANFRFVPRSYLIPVMASETNNTVGALIEQEIEFLINKLTTSDFAKLSRVLTDIRPSHEIREIKQPIPFATYDIDCHELLANLPVYYQEFSQSTSLSVWPRSTSASQLTSRNYYISREVWDTNLFTFGSQCFMDNFDIPNTTTVNWDQLSVKNFGGIGYTFPKFTPSLNNNTGTYEQFNRTNYFTMDVKPDGSVRPNYEWVAESACVGSGWLTEIIGGPTPGRKIYSCTPNGFQGAYYTGPFAVTDAVRKLMDVIFDIQ